MKKIAIGLFVVLLAGVVAVVVGVQMFARGVGGFDDWVVRKVVDVAETYLVPDVEFDSFDYGDGVVTLEGVRLVAPDGTEVVRASALEVTLAGLPRRGEGVTIERVAVRGGDLRLIRSEGGGFAGLVPFVERERVRDQSSVEDDQKMSNAFRIRRIELDDCSIEYVGGEGEAPMRLGGIEVAMDVTPASEGSSEYAVDLEIDRSPVLKLSTHATANLETLGVDVGSLTLEADLEHEEAVSALPGALQELLQRYDAKGTLSIEASGRVDGRSVLDSSVEASARLDGFNFAMGEYRLPIDEARVDATMSDRAVTLATLEATTCGGRVDASGATLDLSDSSSIGARLAWSVSGFEMRELLRTHAGGEDEAPRIAGVVESSGEASGTLGTLPGSVSGHGTVSVRQGRLVNMPLQRELARAMDIIDLIAQRKATFEDEADVEFDLAGEGIQVRKATVQTSLLAARGDGTISYAGDLDLLVNAGPLEKLQEATGVIGDVLGLVTDQLVKYGVKGTVGAPEVKVRPLGIGG